MTFPFRRKIQFYSSKTKEKVLDEVEKMLAEENFTNAEGEAVTGNFVIRTTNRLLFFNVVFCGDVYEFEGRTFIILFAKMRMVFEILLLIGIGMAGTGVFYLFSENGFDYDLLFGMGFIFLLCVIFWAINYLQFKPALNSVKSKLE